jgi:hypothetical protein
VLRHDCLLRGVGHYLGHRRLHIGAEGGAELRIVRNPHVVCCPHEAVDESRSKVVARSCPGVDFERRRMSAEASEYVPGPPNASAQ